MTARNTAIILALAAALIVSAVLCVGLGPVKIASGTVIDIIAAAIHPSGAAPYWSQGFQHIVLELRIPRIIIGGLVGAGLAVVGAVLQTITRNPLADPYLFGVSSGAAVGAVTVLLYTGAVFGAVTLPLAAFVGALGAMALVFLLAKEGGGFATERLILTGVAINFILGALTNTLVLGASDRGVENALFWMLGGFSNARWNLVSFAVIAVAIGLFWIMRRADLLDALSLGDENAHTLGANVPRLRLEMFIVSALMTGVLVSISGAVGFIGLIMPHCARWLVGARLRAMVPVGALMGAIFAIWMDVSARSLFAPRELPLGVMTAAVGGLFFIVVLKRRQRR